MFVRELARQAPRYADVAEVVYDMTEQIPVFPMVHQQGGANAEDLQGVVHSPYCRRCQRLAEYRDAVKVRYPAYACLPVPSFGDLSSPLLILGLAPGLHGANASNRPFTGDGAGPLLYGTLCDLGLAKREPPVAVTDHPSSITAADGLELRDCRIANSVKCLPPENKPLPDEVRACNSFVRAELEAMPQLRVVVALGTVSHNAALRALGARASDARFAHGARHVVGGFVLYDSYHCSRYNQNTGRLTPAMFRAVIAQAAAEAGIARFP